MGPFGSKIMSLWEAIGDCNMSMATSERTCLSAASYIHCTRLPNLAAYQRKISRHFQTFGMTSAVVLTVAWHPVEAVTLDFWDFWQGFLPAPVTKPILAALCCCIGVCPAGSAHASALLQASWAGSGLHAQDRTALFGGWTSTCLRYMPWSLVIQVPFVYSVKYKLPHLLVKSLFPFSPSSIHVAMLNASCRFQAVTFPSKPLGASSRSASLMEMSSLQVFAKLPHGAYEYIKHITRLPILVTCFFTYLSLVLP